MPYCNYYVAKTEIAELVIKTGINESYNVAVYDHNESSLYKLIDDLTSAMKIKSSESNKKSSRTMYRKGR